MFFPFTNDDSFVEIQAIFYFREPVKYLYFGIFREDSMRVAKKFTPATDKVSYSDTAVYYQYVKATRVMLDNILVLKLDTVVAHCKDIYYQTDEDQITSTKDKVLVSSIGQQMNDHPNTYLLIQGYTDPADTVLYNLDLSERRAAYVKALLVEQGIDERRIVTIGRGILNAESEKREAGYARKVSFRLLGL